MSSPKHETAQTDSMPSMMRYDNETESEIIIKNRRTGRDYIRLRYDRKKHEGTLVINEKELGEGGISITSPN